MKEIKSVWNGTEIIVLVWGKRDKPSCGFPPSVPLISYIPVTSYSQVSILSAFQPVSCMAEDKSPWAAATELCIIVDLKSSKPFQSLNSFFSPEILTKTIIRLKKQEKRKENQLSLPLPKHPSQQATSHSSFHGNPAILAGCMGALLEDTSHWGHLCKKSAHQQPSEGSSVVINTPGDS